MKPVALYYLALLDGIRAVGKSLGYAIGLHGTMQRDFDLIACPWTEDARPAEELVDAVARLVKGNWHPQTVDNKPHGRKAWAIHIGWHDELKTTTLIDLSVMPRTGGVNTAPALYPATDFGELKGSSVDESPSPPDLGTLKGSPLDELHRDVLGSRRCPRCDGQMMHSRLRGYHCVHNCG